MQETLATIVPYLAQNELEENAELLALAENSLSQMEPLAYT